MISYDDISMRTKPAKGEGDWENRSSSVQSRTIKDEDKNSVLRKRGLLKLLDGLRDCG